MLGAAHVLAMDSKNLLDVVDAIRIRHPHLCRHLWRDSNPQPEQRDVEKPEYTQSFATLPAPVTCTFVRSSPNSIQCTTSSSNVNNASDEIANS